MSTGDVGEQTTETSFGTVEYTDRGRGSAVLFVHGSPGGRDQGALTSDFLTRSRRVVAISRPGHRNTPLSAESAGPSAQATMAAEIMSGLGIDRYSIVCWSGGGPASYTLAAAYPGRVTAVVGVAAVSASFDPAGTLRGRLELVEERMLFTGVGRWLTTTFAERAPATAMSTPLAGEGT
ncbi:alpha/beta fold hydrolase [Gordonia soli]|uniref:Putative hydrolase n=1 Tax=Gordonia soli NBRC 108243 TaxID=1223545 RepID=M0QMR9_9ACTN|nr:alpha/beta fold hydrolase [Gordonia soli]GAC69719.1 putative hydrolase [Gordonia soli NBRC 108243]